MPLSYQDLPPSLKADLDSHWQSSSPKEAVGLVLTDGSTLRLRNWSRRTDRFYVGWWTIFWNLGWSALWRGDGISMVYHSHHAVAEPSETDKAFIAVTAHRWPGVTHLIFVPGYEYGVWQYVG